MQRADASPRKIRLLSAVLLVLTFAAGTVTGAGVLRWADNAREVHRPPPHIMSAPPPFHELELTAEQRKNVRAVFEHYRPEIEAVMRDAFPKVRAINEKIEAEAREFLTAEQRTKLDQIKARRAAHPGPPLGPPPGARSGMGDQWAPPPRPWDVPPPPTEEKK